MSSGHLKHKKGQLKRKQKKRGCLWATKAQTKKRLLLRMLMAVSSGKLKPK